MAAMSFGSSGRSVKATVSRAEENQTGVSSPLTKIWPRGPPCSLSIMPQ